MKLQPCDPVLADDFEYSDPLIHMDSSEIDGAELFESPISTHKRRLTLQSTDRKRLAVVSEGPDGLFRVQICVRVTDPHYGGPTWSGVSDPSLTDSLAAAEALARARLDQDVL